MRTVYIVQSMIPGVQGWEDYSIPFDVLSSAHKSRFRGLESRLYENMDREFRIVQRIIIDTVINA